MKSLRLFAPYDMRLQDEPIPEIGPHDVLTKVKSVGLCASDSHWYRECRIGTTIMTEPLVLGHEAAGEIVAVGNAVTNVKPGDRVAIEPAYHCGECEFCRMGEFNICPTVQFMGTPPTNGSMREYVAWPSHLVIPIPDSMSFDEAAMIEPLAIGVFAVDLAKMCGGERVAVIGAGAVGLSVVAAAKAAGVGEIYVSEPIPERRKAAEMLGATKTFSPEEAGSAIAKLTGYGPDIVFECAGELDALRQSAEIARPLGKVMVIGIPDEDDYIFPASASRRKQLTAIFVRRSRGTTERAIELVEKGQAQVALLATHRFSAAQIKEAFELAISRKDGIIRAVIDMSAD